MSDLEDFKSFVRRHFGVQLSETQVKMYEAVVDKKTLYQPRRMGITNFNNMYPEYLRTKQ